MQKCFYHGKTDAVTMCMGCKMPICATCRDEGKKAFCQSCIKKVAHLGEQEDATRRTGPLQNVHRATMVKVAGRSTSPKNVTYCFQHFDVPASATCPTCSRPFCPGCLNGAGICSHCAKLDQQAKPAGRSVSGRTTIYCVHHADVPAQANCPTCSRAYCPGCLNSAGICPTCAKYNVKAQERMFAPNEKGRKILEEVAEAEAKKRWGPREYVVASGVVVLMIVGWKHFHQPPPAVDQTAATLQKLHESDLTPDQQAMLDKLSKQKKVDIPVPVETPVPKAAPVAAAVPAGHAAQFAAGGQPAGHGGVLVRGGGVRQAFSRAPAVAGVHIGFLAPGRGATVRGLTSVSASVSGTPGRIDLLVDGEFSSTINSRPFRFEWPSQGVGNGSHRLTLQALGEAGVLSQSTVTVNVQN